MGGYVQLDRKIMKWEWYDDANTFRVFVHLLLTCNHKAAKWHGQNVLRGQVITGRLKLATVLGLTEMQVRTSLNKLKNTGEITIKTTNQNSLVTICKYNTYQSKENEDNQQNNQQTIQRITNEQPTDNQRVTTNNNDNKEKKEKKIIHSTYKPIAENFNGLPEIKVGAVIQLLKITKQVDVSTDDVTGLWEIFKVQNLTGKKPYKDEEDVHSHFINWSKNQKQNNGKRDTSNKSNTKSVGRTITFDRP